MKRKMSNLLLKWKEDKNKMPLIVHGARQVGKTYIILSFGKANYKNVAYINFEDNKDMAKYASSTETTKIIAVYNIISAQLAKENKKFQYKLIKSGARAYEYENAINWLNASGIIVKCTKIKEGKLPLSAFIEPDSFKIYMNDVGLLCSKFGNSTNMILVDNDNLNNFKGALAENYVCSSLVKSGLIPYYWESKGIAELDFIVQDKEGNIIPIEVKSEENTRSKSLNVFKNLYKITYSIRISTKNFGYENDIKCIPLYSVFCLDELTK